MTHFLLSPRNSQDAAVACAPDNAPPYFTVMTEMSDCLKAPFDLALKQVSFTKNGSVESSALNALKCPWLDYQPNSFAWPLVSQKLRNIIDCHASGKEQHEWLPVKIDSETGDSRIYFVLRFSKQHDVLDIERSVFRRVPNEPDYLIKPVFSQEKTAPLCVFGYDEMFWQIPSGIYVSLEVRNAAKQEGLSGLHFENVKVF